MAFLAVRTLSNGAARSWRHTPTFNRILSNLAPSGNKDEDLSSAFWDPTGSVAVDESMAKPSGADKQSTMNMFKEMFPPNTPEQREEVVRLTNFGHIRLDRENPSTIAEEDRTLAQHVTEENSPLNFIDNQFFGSQVSTPNLDRNTPWKATDVPLDTNPIDQQYFYPDKSTSKVSSTTTTASPSANELEFEGHEIDDQYFGKKSRISSESEPTSPPAMSAYEYLRILKTKKESPSNASIRIQPTASTQTEGTDPVKTPADLIPNFRKMPKELIASMLKKSVLYNKDGIVALDKPYGMATTDVDHNADIVLANYLPILGQLLKYEKLHTVHRLDRDTTGVLLLATSPDMAAKLNKLFLERKIKKKYLALTKGVPDPPQATINIPICEKNMGDRQRMGLRPVKSHHEPDSARYNARSKSSMAITHYKVVRSTGSAALVELEPETGVRHQLRVHLSEAINCQILGDHKYAHRDRYAPQKLPDDMLDCLGVRQSKVRNLPMHLHAASVSIPELGENGGDLIIRAALPAFFRLSMRKLKLYSSKKGG